MAATRGLPLALALAVALAAVVEAQTELVAPAYDLKLNNINDEYSDSNLWAEMQSACALPCRSDTAAYPSAI
jgi:hypothetical protein